MYSVYSPIYNYYTHTPLLGKDTIAQFFESPFYELCCYKYVDGLQLKPFLSRPQDDDKA